MVILFSCNYQVFLKDTDERACAYIAGPAPNRWGFSVEGNDLLRTIGNISTNNGQWLYFMLDHLYQYSYNIIL